ncbi:MAG: transporter substrate-binding domain-containing protein, partial [Desulfobulbales bacterium]
MPIIKKKIASRMGGQICLHLVCLVCFLFAFTDLTSAQNSVQELSQSQQNADSLISLTAEEQAWLKAHPDIQLGYTDAFEPEVIVNPDGSHTGILVDFLEALNKRLGTRITLRIDSIPGILQKAKTKEVDGILEVHPEYADKLGLLKSVGYLRAYPAVFARKDVSFAGPDDFAGKKIAIIDKVYFTEKMVREYGEQSTILRVKDAIQGMKSVSDGTADLYIGVSFNSYYITKYQLFDVVIKYVFDDFPDKFGMAVRPDWPELVPILNKGIASFSQNEIDTIVAKWIHLQQQENTIELTSEEQAWLAAHPKITLGGGIFAPLDFIDSKGKAAGLGPDYARLISSLLGIEFEYVSGDWAKIQEMARQKQIDGIRLLFKNEEREQYLNFSESYSTLQHAILTLKSSAEILSLQDLSGKRVGTMNAVYAQRYMQKHYPDIVLVAYPSVEDALQAVANGDVEAAVVSLAVAGAAMDRLFITNLKVSALAFELAEKLHLGIRKDWPEFTTIINKAIKAIPVEKHSEIKGRWVSHDYVDNKKQVELTPQEQAWLQEHPIITLGGGNFAPLDFFDKTKGQSDGVGPDYAKLIGSMLGVEFKLVSGGWQDIQNKAKAKEIDGIRLIFKSKEREKYLNYTKPVVTISHAIVMKKETERASSLKELSHKRVGTMQGLYTYHYVKEHYPDLDLITYPTWEKVLRALVNNEVEAVVGTLPVITHMTNKLFLTNLKVTALPPEMEREAYLGIRPDWPELSVIINKAIDAITIEQHSEIKQKWVALYTEDKEDQISLTPKEQAWLDQDHAVQVRVVNLPPYM